MPNHPTLDRTRTRRRPGLLGLALAMALLAGAAACGSDDDSSSDPTGSTVAGGGLGTPDAATGEPVKVGFISDGRTPSVDNSAFAVAAKATVDYANAYMGGIGGHRIELVECATTGDPGKATDCANQMVQDEVALVLMPESLQPGAVNTVTQANQVPLYIYAVTDPAILEAEDFTYNMGNRASALSTLPIDIAEENDIDKVSVLVVDVPAATAGYEGALKPEFEAAGVELDLVKVPLGQADISQQIIGIVDGGPTVVHIVGDATLCIAGINGLRTNGFTGPISTVTNCLNSAIREAVGSNIDGLTTAALAPTEDPTNTGLQLWDAILAEYAPGFEDPAEGLTTFMTVYSALQTLQDMEGEITPATVNTTIRTAPELPLVTGDGLGFRCNGKAIPDSPAACTRGSLRVSFDAEGEPILPWTAFGTSPIPD